jgi:hypothetical protein
VEPGSADSLPEQFFVNRKALAAISKPAENWLKRHQSLLKERHPRSGGCALAL